MFKLSICIPTYNRAKHLKRCLNSVQHNIVGLEDQIQICISNNCSTDETYSIISKAKEKFSIKLVSNKLNIGMARNIMQVASMGDGEFIWMIGDDDLFMPNAFREVLDLIRKNEDVDYFYINSYNLNVDYFNSLGDIFTYDDLPKNVTTFSPRKESGKLPFLELVDPNISFDFLGGIFLSVFRKDIWVSNSEVLNHKALLDERVFSDFDNTFPQIKVLANSFARSTAYFCSEAHTVCISGVREWGDKSPLVKSIRLVEALQVYRMNGLNNFKYYYCKNRALDTFGSDLLKMCFNRKKSGIEHINIIKVILSNMKYPNFYLSFLSPIFRISFWKRLYQFCKIIVGR